MLAGKQCSGEGPYRGLPTTTAAQAAGAQQSLAEVWGPAGAAAGLYGYSCALLLLLLLPAVVAPATAAPLQQVLLQTPPPAAAAVQLWMWQSHKLQQQQQGVSCLRRTRVTLTP
jgi:hypothetical protein